MLKKTSMRHRYEYAYGHWTGRATGGQATFCRQCDSQGVTAGCGGVREERALKTRRGGRATYADLAMLSVGFGVRVVDFVAALASE